MLVDSPKVTDFEQRNEIREVNPDEYLQWVLVEEKKKSHC